MEAALGACAEGQYGVVTRAQLLGAGLSADAIFRWRRQERIIELLPSVFRLRGYPESFEQRVWAATSWGGVGSAACLHTAAVVHGLEGVASDPVQLSVPHEPRPPGSPGFKLVLHEARKLGHWDLTQVRGLWVTRIERTLVDLAAELSADELEKQVDDALRRRLTQPRRIQACFKRLRAKGRHGVARFGQVLDRRQGSLQRTETDDELRLLGVLVEAGLRPMTQHEVPWAEGRTYRLDLAFPSVKVGLEMDGYASHGSRRQWAQDQTRTNVLVKLGWVVLRFTRADLENPEEVVSTVRQTLAARRQPGRAAS